MLYLNVIYPDNREELVELSSDTVLQVLIQHLKAKDVEILAYNPVNSGYKCGGNGNEDGSSQFAGRA